MMKNNNNDKVQLLSKPSIQVDGTLPTIHIKDYDGLIERAKNIRASYKKADYNTVKDARQAYRQVNRANRGLNNLRKDITKPGRMMFKDLKGKIDAVIKILNDAKQAPKARIDTYKKQKTQKILSHWKPVFNSLCVKYNIQPFPFPKECLKVSLSGSKRNNALDNAVHQQAIKEEQQTAVNIHGHAVCKKTGSVVGDYKNLIFVGDNDQLKTLLDFASNNNITLRKE